MSNILRQTRDILQQSQEYISKNLAPLEGTQSQEFHGEKIDSGRNLKVVKRLGDSVETLYKPNPKGFSGTKISQTTEIFVNKKMGESPEKVGKSGSYGQVTGKRIDSELEIKVKKQGLQESLKKIYQLEK